MFKDLLRLNVSDGGVIGIGWTYGMACCCMFTSQKPGLFVWHKTEAIPSKANMFRNDSMERCGLNILTEIYIDSTEISIIA